MDPSVAEEASEAARQALAAGDWEAACTSFEAALESGDSADDYDGLSQALWWAGDANGAVVNRERAYALYREGGSPERAARAALWLAREYGALWGNEGASKGWLARADRILADRGPGVERAWLELTRAERAGEPAAAEQYARAALSLGLKHEDSDVELRALAVLGLAEIELGRVEQGLERVDEAMAGATGGEAGFETLADVSCRLLLACELASDEQRSRQWMQVLDTFVRERDDMPLLNFCTVCGADVSAAIGDLEAAERVLSESIRELPMKEERSRCVHPATRLARVRLQQGRLEEAERLVSGHESTLEGVPVAAELRIARGEPEAAAALLEQRLDELDRSNQLAAPLLGLLVEAAIAAGDLGTAGAAAGDLDAIARAMAPERVRATALFARGRIAAAEASAEAQPLLREAEMVFEQAEMPLEASRVRLELAATIAPDSPEVAIDLARRARAEFERLGAEMLADRAKAQLRALGARGSTGPKDFGELSKREVEVLRLLAEGLSNPQIGERLFISPKTAEHHVSRILMKLDVRSRAEAAALAATRLPEARWSTPPIKGGNRGLPPS